MAGKCKRAFVIGLDGAIGGSVREAATPNIDEILSEGIVDYSAQTVFPSSSFEAWGAMFHGVGPEKHKLNGDHPCPEDVPWPSFMKVAKQKRPEIKCASFSCWEPINTHIIEGSCDCHSISMPDPALTATAAAYIRAYSPDIYFMQLDFIDAAGHSHGYGSQEYLEQITATDALVGVVIDAIRDAGIFDESLIVLLSDHGGEGKSHGSDHPDCMTIFWGCRGPGIPSGIELENQVNIMDTAAVVAYALGLPAPEGWDARECVSEWVREGGSERV
jgi:hypothetical protein